MHSSININQERDNVLGKNRTIMDINYYINDIRNLIKFTLCEKSIFVRDIIADL